MCEEETLQSTFVEMKFSATVALLLASMASAATTFPANTAVAHVDFSRQTSNLYVVSERIQYARMETDILSWSSARVRGGLGGSLFGSMRLGVTGSTGAYWLFAFNPPARPAALCWRKWACPRSLVRVSTCTWAWED